MTLTQLLQCEGWVKKVLVAVTGETIRTSRKEKEESECTVQD